MNIGESTDLNTLLCWLLDLERQPGTYMPDHATESAARARRAGSRTGHISGYRAEWTTRP